MQAAGCKDLSIIRTINLSLRKVVLVHQNLNLFSLILILCWQFLDDEINYQFRLLKGIQSNTAIIFILQVIHIQHIVIRKKGFFWFLLKFISFLLHDLFQTLVSTANRMCIFSQRCLQFTNPSLLFHYLVSFSLTLLFLEFYFFFFNFPTCLVDMIQVNHKKKLFFFFL